MSTEAPVSLQARTIHDIVPHDVLESLGYIPGRNQGSFMFLIEGLPDQVGLAHVFDAKGERPNVIVVEHPVFDGEIQRNEWYLHSIPGPAYEDLDHEQRKAFHSEIQEAVHPMYNYTEEGIVNILVSFV